MKEKIYNFYVKTFPNILQSLFWGISESKLEYLSNLQCSASWEITIKSENALTAYNKYISEFDRITRNCPSTLAFYSTHKKAQYLLKKRLQNMGVNVEKDN